MLILTGHQSLGSSYASIESDRGSGGRPAIEVPNGAPAVRGASVGLGWKIQTFRRIRLCIRRLRAPDNRRFRLVSISARNVQPSGSRRAVIKRPRLRTHSCLKIRGSWVRNPHGAARARGVPFRFGSRDGDAFVGRHPARRETHCARWRGWGSVGKETGERSRTRTRTIDRSVGRSVVVFGIRAPVPSDDDSRGAKNTNERNPLRGSSSPSPRAVGRVRGWRHGRTRG